MFNSLTANQERRIVKVEFETSQWRITAPDMRGFFVPMFRGRLGCPGRKPKASRPSTVGFNPRNARHLKLSVVPAIANSGATGMTAIIPLTFESHPVRVIDRNGELWFVSADVCQVLEIENNRKATSRLDDDEKGVTISNTPGGNQEMTTVNESGLYTLIFRSRKASAKRFRKWVTSEVLPSIRKTGKYKAAASLTSPQETAPNEDRTMVKAIAEAMTTGDPLLMYVESLRSDLADIVKHHTVNPIRAGMLLSAAKTRIKKVEAVLLEPKSYRMKSLDERIAQENANVQ